MVYFSTNRRHICYGHVSWANGRGLPRPNDGGTVDWIVGMLAHWSLVDAYVRVVSSHVVADAVRRHQL